MSEKFDVLLAGHITKDRLIIGKEESQRTGGAVYYGAFPLKQLGKKVGVITKLAAADRFLLDEFEQFAIPVVARPSRCTTEMTLLYPAANSDRREIRVGAVADPFCPEDFVEQSAEIIHICPLLNGEISAEVVASLSQRARLGLDVQGFIRVRKGDQLHIGDWLEKREVLAMVTFLKVDEAEAEILTGIKELHGAAESLASLGPREVMVTHQQGILVYAEGRFHSAAFGTQSLIGRTGRGDTCMSTYLGRRLTHSPEQACRLAAAVATAKLQQAGPFKGDLAALGL